MKAIEGCGILTQCETEILSRVADEISSLQQAHAVAVTLASGDLSAITADLGRSAR